MIIISCNSIHLSFRIWLASPPLRLDLIFSWIRSDYQHLKEHTQNNCKFLPPQLLPKFGTASSEQ